MAGEELRMVRAPLTGDPLDPAGGGYVLACTGGPRDLRVGDVSHEHVPEDVLDVVLDRGLTHATDEFLACKLVQTGEDRFLRTATHGRESAGPEHLAYHGGVVHEHFAVGRKRVKTRGDHALDSFGDRDLECVVAAPGQQTPVVEHTHELFRV